MVVEYQVVRRLTQVCDAIGPIEEVVVLVPQLDVCLRDLSFTRGVGGFKSLAESLCVGVH